jgi:hypothetical protein
MKKKTKYHTVGTKSNKRIVETEIHLIPITHMYTTTHYLDTLTHMYTTTHYHHLAQALQDTSGIYTNKPA